MPEKLTLIKKKIVFAHSGGSQSKAGQGSYDFVKSLRKELGSGFEIQFPVIEKPEAPTYAMWKKMFDVELKKTKEPLIIIGHSLGGSMILKYLSEEKIKVNILGMFLVAIPYWGAGNWQADEFVLRKDFTSHLPPIARIQLYQSEDDAIVPFNHFKLYQRDLPAADYIRLPGQDHVFLNGLPELVKQIRAL
jgi:hypothetical protein